MGRTHMDKITLEGLIAKNSYDEEEDSVGNSLLVYHLGAAFMPNEKMAIGASVQIWDVEDGLFDLTKIALDGVFKIQENMFLGAGVSKLTYAYDTELDDKKTLHGGFGMLTKDVDFEGVLTVAPGDSNKTKGVYRESEASLIFSGVYRINENLEFSGRYTTTAEASDYSDLNVDTEESTSIVELELEYEISEHLFVAGSIEGTSSEYTDNNSSDNNFETTGNSKGLRFRYLKDQFEGQFAYTVDSSEKDAKDNDEDEDESSNSYSFLLAYKF